MSVDFCDAAHRHYEDATQLFESKKFPNADHLYGLGAECALKAIMVGLGAPAKDGDLEDEAHHLHINKLWSEFQVFVNGRSASRYATPLRALQGEPFDKWHIAQRYAHRRDISSGKIPIEHQKAAKACLVALERAMADGRVSWIR